jgi:protein-tyrosine phosphatase
VLDFGFPDHTAPPLELLFKITASMASWLNADPENIAVVHCMVRKGSRVIVCVLILIVRQAGLGRTGTVICAYMLYSGMCTSASAALRFFGQRRCRDSRGVRIPSQIRYGGLSLLLFVV